MPSWLRSILAVIAGIVAGVIVVSITDATTHALYPLPEGTDVTNREALSAAIATIPTAAFVISIAGWTVGAFAAAFVAAKLALSRKPLAGYIAGMLLFASTLLNLFLIPHPTWMLPVTCVLLPVTVWLAVRMAAPSGRGPTAAAAAA